MSGFDVIGAVPGGAPRLVEGRVGIGASPETAIQDKGTEGPRSGFASALFDALKRVDNLQQDVSERSDAISRGEGGSVQDLMVAMGKSDVAFNLMLEVRNKIVDAWQTLTRTVV